MQETRDKQPLCVVCPPLEARIDDVKSKDDEISDKLGDYMLKGWTMLDETCDCQVPLMRSKQGDKICVECKATKKEDVADPAAEGAVPLTVGHDPIKESIAILEDAILEAVRIVKATAKYDSLSDVQEMTETLERLRAYHRNKV